MGVEARRFFRPLCLSLSIRQILTNPLRHPFRMQIRQNTSVSYGLLVVRFCRPAPGDDFLPAPPDGIRALDLESSPRAFSGRALKHRPCGEEFLSAFVEELQVRRGQERFGNFSSRCVNNCLLRRRPPCTSQNVPAEQQFAPTPT